MVAVAQQRGVAVGVREEGLLAGGGELDGAARTQRQQAERELDAGVLAVGGGAGDAGHHDLDLVRFQAEGGGGQITVGVRVRGGGVDLHAAIGARHREPGLGPDGRRVLAADPVEPLDHHLADGVGVAEAERDVPDQVAVGVQRLGLEGELGIGDGFLDLVLDGDGGGGQPCRVGVVGRHRGDRLAVVADLVLGEDRAVGGAPAVPRVPGDVLVRDDDAHARHLHRGLGVDGPDPGARVR